jgi:hypothetical protein
MPGPHEGGASSRSQAVAWSRELSVLEG